MIVITQIAAARPAEYVLATGASAVDRLLLLHKTFGPAGKRFLQNAGLRAGMNVADFGCGIGATTRMLAEMVGPGGSVTAIDASEDQLVECGRLCTMGGQTNVALWKADVTTTGLPSETFDLVYCRFLFIHLQDPAGCLREMRRVLKPGGILAVEDGDLGAAGSIPPSALDEFGRLFGRLGPMRGVDYRRGRDLYHLVTSAGFFDAEVDVHQRAVARGECRDLLRWTFEEAGEGFVNAALISDGELGRTVACMRRAADDPNVLVMMPKMFQVSARKPV
jgi:SAM-dependent methyltransferase